MVATRNKYYDNVNPLNGPTTEQSTNSAASPPNPTPLTIPMELTIKPPKGVIHKSSFNPHALRITL